MVNMTLTRAVNKGQGHSFWFQLISRTPSYRLSIVTMMHRLATIHSIQTTNRRQTDETL